MASEFKKEMDFALDNFGKQKYLSSVESIGQTILNLFVMRPGNIPSMPELGININQYIYNLTDEIDVDEIKNKLQQQCSELLPYLILGEIRVFIQEIKGQDVLMIALQIETDQSNPETLVYGFAKDKTTGETISDFQQFSK